MCVIMLAVLMLAKTGFIYGGLLWAPLQVKGSTAVADGQVSGVSENGTIQVVYEVGGEDYTFQDRVVAGTLSVGDLVQVNYSETSPQYAVVSGSQMADHAIRMILFEVALTLIVFALGIWIYVRMGRGEGKEVV